MGRGGVRKNRNMSPDEGPSFLGLRVILIPDTESIDCLWRVKEYTPWSFSLPIFSTTDHNFEFCTSHSLALLHNCATNFIHGSNIYFCLPAELCINGIILCGFSCDWLFHSTDSVLRFSSVQPRSWESSNNSPYPIYDHTSWMCSTMDGHLSSIQFQLIQTMPLRTSGYTALILEVCLRWGAEGRGGLSSNKAALA